MLRIFKKLLSWPYSHLLVSTAISLVAYVLAGQVEIPWPLVRVDAILAGSLFYAGREFIQWRRHPDKWFDGRGFFWGVAPMAIAWVLAGWVLVLAGWGLV